MDSERESKVTRRRFLKYIGGISAAFGVGALFGSKLTPPVHANAPASTTIQPDIISSYLYTGPAGAMAYTYNSDGTIATMTYGGLTCTYGYNADGSVNTCVSTLGSITVTDTYAYDSTGSITGVTRA